MSKEPSFAFDIAEINLFLAAEGKILKLEGGLRAIDPRWSLLLGAPPVPGSTKLVFSYVMADLTYRETLLYLRGFRMGLEEERHVGDTTLQTMVDKFNALLKQGTKPL